MADNTDELGDLLARLYRPSKGLAEALSLLRASFSAQSGGAEANTRTTENVVSTAASTAGIGGRGVWDDAISPILGRVLGSMPLVSGLVSLFSGGDNPTVSNSLTRYTPPPSIQISAGLFHEGSKLDAADYSQDGSLRATGPSTVANAVTPSVVVQVQAMDSQSFLDRSDDIADAVRKALLNSHPLGDVIN